MLFEILNSKFIFSGFKEEYYKRLKDNGFKFFKKSDRTEIEINSLEDLMNLINVVNYDIVLCKDKRIIIYDDYLD